MSLYDELGLTADASPEDIEEAWRSKAKQHHPDKGGDPEAFQRAGRAVAVLRDPVRRKRYDKTGEADAEPDHSTQKIVEIVVRAFDEALAEVGPGDFTRRDIVALMRTAIQCQINHLKVQKSEVNAALKQLKEMRRRLSIKRGLTNHLAHVIAQRISATERQAGEIERMRGFAVQAFEQAGAYSWEVDKEPPQTTFSIFSSATTASGGTTW